MSRKSCELITGAVIIGVLVCILIVYNLDIGGSERTRIRPIGVDHLICYENRPANLTREECLEGFKILDEEKEARRNKTREAEKQTKFPITDQTTQSVAEVMNSTDKGTAVLNLNKLNLTSSNQS